MLGCCRLWLLLLFGGGTIGTSGSKSIGSGTLLAAVAVVVVLVVLLLTTL